MFELTMAASRRTECPTCALQLANEVSNLHDIIVTQADTERKVAECRGDRYSARPPTGSTARHRERTPNNLDGIRPPDSERHTRNRSLSYSRQPHRKRRSRLITLCNISEANAQLSALIEAVQVGEAVIIAKAGKPVARLVRYQGATAPCRPGALKGHIWIADDFDELPADIAESCGAE